MRENDLLRLRSLKVEEIQEDDHSYHITARSSGQLKACPLCDSSNIKKNGTRPQLFNDCPIHGKQVLLNVIRSRYLCKECNKTAHEVISDLSTTRRMTNRLVDYVEKQSLPRTFADVADETGLNEKTVRNIFNDLIPRLEKQHKPETPRWLGIDEIYVIRKPRGVVTNVEQRTVVDVLTNRKKELVEDYLENIRNPRRIRYVAMDMWRPYYNAVQNKLPQAKVVIDKFHVVRMANNALEEARKALRSQLSEKERRLLKRDKYILRKRLHDLTNKEYFDFSCWVNNFPELGEAHALKEGFFSIWDHSDRSAAEQAYDQWQANIPRGLNKHFLPIQRAVGNWHTEIFNYFDHPITNAYTESLNNLIRSMCRMGRGYSFEALRAKILFTAGVQKTKRKVSARARHREDDFMSKSYSFETAEIPTKRKIQTIRYGTDIELLIRAIEGNQF